MELQDDKFQAVPGHTTQGNDGKGSREFRRYLDTARASLHEIEAILDLVIALEYLPAAEVAEIEAVRAECARTVYGLLRRFDPPRPS